MVVPTIDVIDDVNFEYKSGVSVSRGGFSMSLDYKWIPVADWQKACTPLISLAPLFHE